MEARLGALAFFFIVVVMVLLMWLVWLAVVVVPSPPVAAAVPVDAVAGAAADGSSPFIPRPSPGGRGWYASTGCPPTGGTSVLPATRPA